MIVLVLIFLTFAAFIRLLLELYKKSIRKDKTSVWEIRVVASPSPPSSGPSRGS